MEKQLVKYFTENSCVEIKEMTKKEMKGKRVIRVIPQNHKNFNSDKEYVEITEENVMFLSEGDMIILKDKDRSTYWHELKYDKVLQCLYYKADSYHVYTVEEELKNGRYVGINVRNDLFIPEYARAV